MKLIVLLLSLLFIHSLISAQTLTLEQYLSQVQTNNQELISINLSLDAIDKKVRETEVVYAPFVSAALSLTRDMSGPGYGSTLISNESDVTALNASINKKWPSGLMLNASLAGSGLSFDLLSPYEFAPGITLTKFDAYELRPSMRLEQSLIKDSKNGLTQSQIKKALASARAAQYLLIFKKQQLIVMARSAYWGLSLAREVSVFRNASLERAQKLLSWNEGKLKLDLVDKSDIFQSRAAEKLRQLNSELALEDEIKAMRNFNELRGKEGEIVTEDVIKLSEITKEYKNVSQLKQEGERADVLSSRANVESAHYARNEAYYRTGPEAGVFANASLRGLDFNLTGAASQVAGASKPAYTFGVSFSMPLDFSLRSVVRTGFQKDEDSANATLLKAELSARNDWAELTRTWQNIKTRLALAGQIMIIQNERLLNEQKKFQRGRSTTFLLLNTENDLDDATINLYRLMYEELNIISQAELYNTK